MISLDDHMKSWLEWSDLDLLRSIIVFLDTQSWQGSEDSSDDGMTESIQQFWPLLMYFVHLLKQRELTLINLVVIVL